MAYLKFQRAGNARHLLFPYKNLYNRMRRSAGDKNLPVKLTYEQYVKIANTNTHCHYCNKKLIWTKHGAGACHINLDRKNNKSGYNIRNVVAACFMCNMARANRYSYKVWYAMTKVLRDKRGA